MKNLRIAAAIAALCALLAGCGNAPGGGYVSSPPAYGAAGQCYYVDDVAEVAALQAAGLCPVNWAPAPMPMTWRSQYAYFYDSPTYYNRYVPVSRRTTYITHVHVYEKANPKAVVRAPRVSTPKQQPASSFRAGTGRQGGDAGSSRVGTSVRSRPSTFSSGSRSSSGGSSSGFRSGSRR